MRHLPIRLLLISAGQRCEVHMSNDIMDINLGDWLPTAAITFSPDAPDTVDAAMDTVVFDTLRSTITG